MEKTELNVGFQTNLINYLLTKEGIKYLELLDHNLFDHVNHQMVFETLSQYWDKFQEVPNKANLLEFLISDKNSKLKDEEKIICKKIIFKAFEPLNDYKFLEEKIINYAKAKSFLKVQSELPAFADWDASMFEKLSSDLVKINNLGQKFTRNVQSSLHDLTDLEELNRKGIPLPFEWMNKMTTIDGNCSPQLIGLLAPDKAGKTAMMIHLCNWYCKLGLDIVYIDYENGLNEVKRRFYKSILGQNEEWLKDPENKDKIIEGINKHKERFPNIHFLSFSGGSDGVNVSIPYLDDINPDVIIWDDLTIMGCDNKKLDKYSRIEHNCFAIKALNQKYGAFSWSPLKMNADGEVAANKALKGHTDGIFEIQTNDEKLKEGKAAIIAHHGRAQIASSVSGIFCPIQFHFDIGRITEDVNNSNLPDIDSYKRFKSKEKFEKRRKKYEGEVLDE